MHKELQPVPVLDLARTLPADEIPQFLGILEQARGIALARLLSPPAERKESARRVDIKTAADRLGVSVHFLYRHHDDPKFAKFTKREGRKLLFDSEGLSAYLKRT